MMIPLGKAGAFHRTSTTGVRTSLAPTSRGGEGAENKKYPTIYIIFHAHRAAGHAHCPTVADTENNTPSTYMGNALLHWDTAVIFEG